MNAGAVTPGSVPDAEFALRRVAIGDTKASVLRALGTPIRHVSTEESVRWDYPGMRIFFDRNRVGELISTSRKACTPAGACPGMPFDRIERIYGHALLAKRETGSFMEYPGTTSACWLQFAVRRGVVRSVAVKCQP